MSAEVFVSYSSQDHAQVSKIIERLRKAGVSVWMDEGGIDAATLWSEAIVEAINESKVLIMMVSKSLDRFGQCGQGGDARLGVQQNNPPRLS